MYDQTIHQEHPDITVYGKACPLFVPLVEEGWLKDPVTETVARRYLAELLEKDIDTLILGCTHYPLIRSLVGKVAGEKVQLVNPAYETALELQQLLQERGLLNTKERGSESEPYRFYVSDAADKFKRFANSILPYDIETTIKINIEEY
jgi:glutamate racemase